MADSGETVTYREFEERANRLAHLLRAHGLQRLDHYSIFMENNNRYLESCSAGERSGLHYTCVNSHLTADELTYILDNSQSQVLITSREKLDVALDAVARCPRITLCLVVGEAGQGHEITASESPGRSYVDFASAVAAYPSTPIDDERLGTPMLYSSGTTGQPKGIIRALDDVPPDQPLALFTFLLKLWRYREGMVYLSPAPLYHSAPQAAVGLTLRIGGTAIIMERFDPEQYLALVQRYHVTHSQLVPTMFSRMLKMPKEVRSRYDLSSLETVVHAAAPCPVPVKEEMIQWWGPIILEYYGATEAIGFTVCDSQEWLAHPGTVGKVLLGELHILDDDMAECPIGTPGTIWFCTPAPLRYFNDEKKSREASSPDGSMSTVGDMGFVDDDGFLYLTDRKTFMIISGGVNIYPQECENLLITHPKVADAAVFGVPNEDLGEEVKAVVQPMPGIEPDDEFAEELIRFCRAHLALQKCPRSIDFDAELPRLPTGKLYKRRVARSLLGRSGQPAGLTIEVQDEAAVEGNDVVVGRRAWQTLFITSVSIFLVAMDVTIVSVALPGITRSFDHTAAATLSWVFTAYNITFAALLLLAGKLGDRWGRKPTFLGGLVLFALASLLAGIAPSATVLIGARVLQALGSALIYPSSLALLLPEFPVSRRSTAIGIWGGIAGLGGAIAPTLGALLVEWAGWRAVFFINVPFVIAAVSAGIVVLRDSKGEHAHERFDPVAVPMAAIAVGLLVLGVVEGQPWGWTSPRVVACFVVAAVLLPLFVFRSARHPAPLLDLDLFRLRSFTVANIAQALYVGSAFGWLVLMPSFFVNVWHWSPLKAGFGLAPGAAIGALLSPIAGRAADRVGHRGLVVVGSFIGAAGTMYWALVVDNHPHYATGILPGMVLAGLGTTAGFATLTGAMMSRVPPKFYSMAGATRSTIFQLATAVGIAIAVALVNVSGARGVVDPYRRVWWLATSCAVASGLVVAIAFPRRAADVGGTTYLSGAVGEPER